MSQKSDLRSRLRYKFDNTLATGPFALVWWLGLVSAILILITSLVVLAITGDDMGFFKIIWNVMFQAVTPNPVDQGAGPWPFLAAMVFVTLCSLLIFSTLIGVLAAGIEERIRALRRGRSRVLEKNHHVILGWDARIMTIISELIIGNEHRKRSCIVILGKKDKIEMEDEIREKIGPTGNTHIVCRSGDPLNQADLEIASLNTARSIIILSPEDDDPDASVVKALLAIINNPKRRPEPYSIVAEMHHPENVELAKIIAGDEAEILQIDTLTSRIIAQTSRRSGLSIVYTELLDFDGDEIYFRDEPGLVGKTFADTLLAYEDSAVMGIRFKDGGPKLNPPMDTVIQAGDMIIAISENDETVKLSSANEVPIDRAAIALKTPAPIAPERTLILGWNWRALTVISELDHYVNTGSTTTVVVEDPALEAQVEGLKAQMKNQTISCVISSTTERRALDKLGVETYQRVIVLSYSDTLTAQKADARTLVTLLHLRDIAKRTGRSYSIVTELLDDRNRTLAETTQADDFIVSGKVACLLLSQISENRELHDVFIDLFDFEGSEIYLKPASDYVKLGTPMTFYTAVEAARQRSEVALGYRLVGDAYNADKGYGVVVNPGKRDFVTFAEGDKLIVLAENE